jgi:hypothetical protein
MDLRSFHHHCPRSKQIFHISPSSQCFTAVKKTLCRQRTVTLGIIFPCKNVPKGFYTSVIRDWHAHSSSYILLTWIIVEAYYFAQAPDYTFNSMPWLNWAINALLTLLLPTWPWKTIYSYDRDWKFNIIISLTQEETKVRYIVQHYYDIAWLNSKFSSAHFRKYFIK